MSNRILPRAAEGRPCAAIASHLSPRALERWDAGLRAAAEDDEDRSISIYDVIGYDWWTGEGVTMKRIASALRSLGAGPVTVNINSPGGDMFEGLAIYNLLREHKGEVTVKVLGLAASAASVIAMAGDKVEIARAGFFMIHNCWVVASGNRHDLREFADWMEPFDASMADIYTTRTGLKLADVQKQMDGETWIGGSSAVEQGFADELLASDQVGKSESKASASAVRRVEAAIRAAGLPRSEAQRLIHEFKSSLSDSAGSGERDATERGLSDSAALRTTAALAASLTNIFQTR
ncbi:ATP-dependent Clp endopeptidase, proteolytic subunit ClpP [Bordetella bronchiseptica GA96-01]|uniref:head maturation protease, ClpP-related n=1 Tax=Bordetella bronchiseptica TaxID=518 RepID=UPI0004596078|nr:head maturation protease, ClpP-related [Bordetella bronchiseptica]AZW31510.1 peptidase [Bordetella bronchiseptica]KCV40689.1 ATP-dependent Clp endopeptidase, proteolytic subunit ClpP [Bordetella bronchiseptica 345]KDC42174.1 ATP-dependent Clp endopeptidase, proteolytic subunit ClpP [Bordetella bronchiseptica GA96-01]